MQVVRIKPGREKSLLRFHPWIFASAILDIYGDPSPGEAVLVESSEGEFLAWGAYSPDSQIRIRVWSWNKDEQINREFMRLRLHKALLYRKSTLQFEDYGAFRIVYAESDGLPGLIVDRYDQTLVIQNLTWGAEYWRETIVDLLVELTGLQQIYERSDSEVRKLEGLPLREGPISGGNPSRQIKITESGIHFVVDVEKGQKTGFYLDQRNNRKFIREFACGKEVLDCFAYTGGFTLNALIGGAKNVTAVESSSQFIALGQENLRLNGLKPAPVKWVEGDAFKVLRSFRDQGLSFDMIILDPPKFAPTVSQVHRASRGYKDINLLAFKLLREGGLLVTFSCSGGVSEDLFEKIIASAAQDAKVEAKIIGRMGQSADHPAAMNFPQSSYLKGLILSVLKR